MVLRSRPTLVSRFNTRPRPIDWSGSWSVVANHRTYPVSRKTKPWPSPRPIPTGVSFGTYHEALFRAVREFLADVKRAEREAHEEVENIRKKLGIPAVYQPDIHVERYSMAVQVLVAMTMEGAIDMYGVVKFGEEDARKTWKWFHNKGPGGKLQEMIKAAKGIDLDDDA